VADKGKVCMETMIGGYAVTIDECDADLLRGHTWYACRASKESNARVYFRTTERGEEQLSLHRMILVRAYGADAKRTYFRDGDYRNLRRSNLTPFDPRGGREALQVELPTDPVATKKCATCLETKPSTDFETYLRVNQIKRRASCNECWGRSKRNVSAAAKRKPAVREDIVAKRQTVDAERVIEESWARLREAREAVGA
jgi:hypothetical protein